MTIPITFPFSDKRSIRYINAPAFLCRMRTPTKVIFKYGVPDVTGTSKDRSTIFIDKSLKRYLKGKDVVQFLLVYEKAKTALKDLYGIGQQQAHQIATAFEQKAVSKVNIDWKDYERFLTPQIKSVKTVNNIPPELDISNYEPGEQRILIGKVSKPEKEKNDRNIHQGQLSKLQRCKAAANS